jgi:hypothetical protein
MSKVSEFFDLFLDDNAPYSLGVFHQKIMGDTNVYIEDWRDDDENEWECAAANSDKSYSRTVRFEHKSKVSLAQVTRNQTFRQYGEFACMKNLTNIAGVPCADSFFVEDFWSIEKCTESHCVILNVKFRITFSKTTFLKSIIESRTR